MTNRFPIFSAIVILFATQISGFSQDADVNLSQIRQQLSNNLVEPEYRSAPTYCLLVMGPKAEHRIWLVLDGHDVVYVDLNENGNLTDEAERFAVDKTIKLPAGHRHSADNFIILGLIHGAECTLDIMVPNPDYVPQTDAEKALAELYLQNGWRDAGLARIPGFKGRQSLSGLLFTKTPADAQVAWLGGPLTIIPSPELYRKNWVLKKWTEARNGKRRRIDSFSVNVGTIGLAVKDAPEMAFSPISTSEVPDGIHPIATFAFETEAVDIPLELRAGGGSFHGSVSVPDHETAKSVEITLAFPNWQGQNIEPVTRTIVIED